MDRIKRKYHQLMNELFSQEFHIPSPELEPVLSVIPAIRNGSTLLTGIYGTGKTTLVEGYAKRFFVDHGAPNLGKVRCHQELMDTDTLYMISFSSPDAPVAPRQLLNRKIRYINELPRSNPAWQNALLSFFSEGEVSFRDQTFPVPDGINICDRNPDDIGQEGVVYALLDRIDHEIVIPNHGYRPITHPSGEQNIEPLSSRDMEFVWKAVEEVCIDGKILDYAYMLNHYFSACLRPRSIANSQYELPCETCAHRAEICQSLRSTPGQRGFNAMLGLARALAWWQGRGHVEIEDLEYALPYAYAHRLDFHSDVLREWPNPQEYLRQQIIGGHVASKREHWQKAIEARHEHDHDKVLAIASQADDLVVAWLYTTSKQSGGCAHAA